MNSDYANRLLERALGAGRNNVSWRWSAKTIALVLCIAGSLIGGMEACARGADVGLDPSQVNLPGRSPDRFLYAGQVVDELGKPVAGAQVTATARHFENGSLFYIGVVETDALGRFRIDRTRAMGGQSVENLGSAIIRLAFLHPDFCYARLEDVRVFTPAQCANLHITLREGKILRGRVVAPNGDGLGGVMVQAVFENDVDADFRKAILTHSDGSFELKGLTSAVATMQAVVTDPKLPPLSGKMTVDLSGAVDQVTIKTTPIVVAPGQTVHELFGMKLVDGDTNLQERFFLYSPKRLIVLDPGPNVARFQIGDLQRGNAFWFVGNEQIATFDQFASRLLAECEAQQKAGQRDYACRVVYDFSSLDFSGTNTQEMHLTEADIQELRAQVKR